MKGILFLLLSLSLTSQAAMIPASPQISSECEGYLKRAHAPIVTPQPKEFPAEVLALAMRSPPMGSVRPRELNLKKETPLKEQPFWRTKPGLLEKMIEERRVLTSVTHKTVSDGKVKFDMKVAGMVAAPRQFSFKTAQNYPRLKEVADNFRTVYYRPKENRLYLVLTALGYQERMILEVYPASGSERDEIQFEVVWGNFKGMKGFIGFETHSLSKTEMSLIAEYQARTLPLPKILMGLALEAVTQKVAEKLRAFVEADYKMALKCGKL